jgi:hypothetical protein
MEIGIRNRAAAFDDLLPGTFFRALRGTERIFGFVVTDGPRRGAFLFSETGPGSRPGLHQAVFRTTIWFHFQVR